MLLLDDAAYKCFPHGRYDTLTIHSGRVTGQQQSPVLPAIQEYFLQFPAILHSPSAFVVEVSLVKRTNTIIVIDLITEDGQPLHNIPYAERLQRLGRHLKAYKNVRVLDEHPNKHLTAEMSACAETMQYRKLDESTHFKMRRLARTTSNVQVVKVGRAVLCTKAKIIALHANYTTDYDFVRAHYNDMRFVELVAARTSDGKLKIFAVSAFESCDEYRDESTDAYYAPAKAAQLTTATTQPTATPSLADADPNKTNGNEQMIEEDSMVPRPNYTKANDANAELLTTVDADSVQVMHDDIRYVDNRNMAVTHTIAEGSLSNDYDQVQNSDDDAAADVDDDDDASC